MVCGYKFWTPTGNSNFWPSLTYNNVIQGTVTGFMWGGLSSVQCTSPYPAQKLVGENVPGQQLWPQKQSQLFRYKRKFQFFFRFLIYNMYCSNWQKFHKTKSVIKLCEAKVSAQFMGRFLYRRVLKKLHHLTNLSFIQSNSKIFYLT